MPLLIDAYNVLHANKPPPLAGLELVGLCRLLGREPWRRQHARVVCDGAPGPLGLTDSPQEAVTLLYAGHSRSADDLIIDLIDADTAPRRLTVVSSDHEIRRAARRRRARAWTSEHFLHHLAASLAGQAYRGPDKPMPEQLDPNQTDKWLRAFGLDDESEHK